MCFIGRGTHNYTTCRNMCFLARGTHITRDMCFIVRGTHTAVSVGINICFLGREHIHVSPGICVPG